jgi:nifR3 family TIM-barrel protein
MSKINIVNYLKENPFVLAPMAGITDHAFRSFMKEMGAGIVVTELISATGIEYSSEKTFALMSFGKDQHPVGIQLFGEDPKFMARAAQIAQDKGCDFVDINLGCPVPKVVKKGAGSALLKDLPQLRLLLREVKSAINIPLTIKIRTGWDENSRNSEEVIQLAYSEGVEMVSIHGRTRAQAYSGLADWDYITEIKKQSPLPIIGNGDITNAQIAIQRLETSACDGVMIGRGALKNPFIFIEALKLLSKDPKTIILQPTLWQVYQKLHNHLQAYCSLPILLIQLKKFAAWYSSGYSGASQFRKQIFQGRSLNEVLEIAESFLIHCKQQEDTSHESFLMGGHG